MTNSDLGANCFCSSFNGWLGRQEGTVHAALLFNKKYTCKASRIADFEKAYLRGRHDKEFSAIVSKIRSILFLSTPHRGSNLAETLDKLLSACLAGYTRKAYIKELAKDSSTIAELNEDFRHQVSNLQIYSFYELRSTVIKGAVSVSVSSWQ